MLSVRYVPWSPLLCVNIPERKYDKTETFLSKFGAFVAAMIFLLDLHLNYTVTTRKH